jgi:hypothetical protein
MTTRKSEIAPGEYGQYYATYLDYISPQTKLADALKQSLEQCMTYLQAVPLEQQNFRYEQGKWTIAQCVQHLIDTEWVFNYRALRFARKDNTPLPGFDHEAFARASVEEERSLVSLISEFKALRKSTINLFEGFSKEAMLRQGQMSNSVNSVRAIGFINAGHTYHHTRIFTERYVY